MFTLDWSKRNAHFHAGSKIPYSLSISFFEVMCMRPPPTWGSSPCPSTMLCESASHFMWGWGFEKVVSISFTPTYNQSHLSFFVWRFQNNCINLTCTWVANKAICDTQIVLHLQQTPRVLYFSHRIEMNWHHDGSNLLWAILFWNW